MNFSQNGEGPFSSLKIWREKVGNDLNEVPTSADYKLRLLLDQTKELELAVFGCFKDSLFELHEAGGWGMLDPHFVDAQRSRLHAQAAQELINDKNLMLELAREHGLYTPYTSEIRRAKLHTIADYESLGQLRFGMLVWKANVSQDLSTTEDAQATLTEAWRDGMRLIRRCVEGSRHYWAAQQAGGAPGEDERKAVADAAEVKLHSMLEEMADGHHMGLEAVAAAIAAAKPEELASDEDVGDKGEDRYLVPPVKELYGVETATETFNE